jgi:hypothetical protein
MNKKIDFQLILKITILIIFGINSNFAQIGIGNTSPQAALDVTSTNDGLLMPRVALSATNIATINTPTISEMVYNSATSAAGPNQVTPGFYYWDGALWVKIVTGSGAPVTSNNWTTTGNSGTNSSNFIGTTDPVAFKIYTSNAERIKVLPDGQVAINDATPSATDLVSAKTISTDNKTVAFHAYNTKDDGFGIIGENSGFTGRGIVGINTDGDSGIGVYGETNALYEPGIQGFSSSITGTGIVGVGNNLGNGNVSIKGSGAAFSGEEYASISFGKKWGVLGIGNLDTNGGARTPIGGGGGAFNSNKWGVYSFVNNLAPANDFATYFGEYRENEDTPQEVLQEVKIGGKVGGVNYKILGTGAASVSTTMQTRDGERILFAPEAPENWFFDINEVVLTNGKATVTIDPILVDCISDSKPFKVFVQGSENTLGNIRITRNQKDKTFMLEDLGGASNGTVQYSIYAIWKSKENLRFPKYERNIKMEVTENRTININRKK